ncbi:MAG: hypothetical protein JW781_09775, partial [Deltaproteobacteria bacterium]|nr:hypothetical protein [Candidatus Anaeroferrophillacea bacterium]
MTRFVIDHQCPQCGAPAALDETDRFFRCEYCRVASLLTVADHFRYVLPHHAPSGKELIYVPYWRLKGMLFSCLEQTVAGRFIDTSIQAVPTSSLPMSVGFRCQTQKLHFAVTRTDGVFLKGETGRSHFLNLVTERFSGGLRRPILHQAYIGETVSQIYAPFYLDGKMHDAILNTPLAAGDPEALEPVLNRHEKPDWPLTFLATLCPHCGWDLEGDRSSLVLSCGNCRTAWWAPEKRLEQLAVAHVPPR